MALSDIIKSIGGAVSKLNPLSWISDAIGGVTSLITNNQSNKYAQHIADKQLASNEAMNAQNVAAQERINQSQLDFSNNINDIMRSDSHNAISLKKSDLQRAGYSAADPSLQGFTAASLSQPSLTAPQVTSNFDSGVADSLIRGKSSALDNMTKIAQVMTDISLKRAQSKKTQVETQGIVKNNAWIDLEKNAAYSVTLETLENLAKEGKIKDYQAQEMANELQTFNTRFDTLKAQLEGIQITNKHLDEQFRSSIAEVLARTANIKADTSNKNIQRDLLRLDKDMKEIEFKFAKLGIDFHANDLFSSIAKISVSGAGPEVVSSVMTAVDQIIGTLVEGLWNGTKEVGNRVLNTLSSGVFNNPVSRSVSKVLHLD